MMNEIYLPVFHHFENGNVFTGSLGAFQALPQAAMATPFDTAALTVLALCMYPADKAAWYGIPCTHAHFRYVGVEAAKFMTEHDLCLEEFISLYDPDAVYIPDNGRLA